MDGQNLEVALSISSQSLDDELEDDQNLDQVAVGINSHSLSDGLAYLTSLPDPKLVALIKSHPISTFNEEGMTIFQNLIRVLVEEGGRPKNRARRYKLLGSGCLNEVSPDSVARLRVEQIVQMGIPGKARAEAVKNFGAHFRDDAQARALVHRSSEQLFREFKRIPQLGPFAALNLLVIGMKRFDFMPINEPQFKKKIKLLYVDEPSFKNWGPYQGLAAWFIWSYTRKNLV